MGKHLKTKLDYEMIYSLAKEVKRVEPDNPVLAKYLAMENFEGAELRKQLKE
tara:strand:+ start:283 stop:438 length:156 start_codon:yes stop_codon:yes gene_type:complete